MYAAKLTKEDLIRDGYTFDLTDGIKIFRYGEEIEPYIIPNKTTTPYLGIQLYKYDEKGNKIKRYIPKPNKPNYYTYWYRTVGLHRALWAWVYNFVPEGYVVDHISNKHDCLEDYTLDNLRLLTPGENLEAQRGKSNKLVKCNLNKPLSYYTDRLNNYIIAYEKAKQEHNASLAHKTRSMVAHIRGQINYYDTHKEVK